MTEDKQIKEVWIIYEDGEKIILADKELTALVDVSDVLETIRLFVKAWRSRGNVEIHS